MSSDATRILAEVESKFPALPALVKQFVATITHSTNSRETYARVLGNFFAFVGKDPAEVTIHDWDAYAAHLNARDVCMETKHTYHAQIKSFFDFAEVRLLRTGVDFRNPIPKGKWAGLTEHVSQCQAKHAQQDKLLPKESIKAILDAARRKSFRDYIFYLLKVHTGARTGEIVTIKIADIHLDERWVGTCMEDGARKSNRSGLKPLPFFFPQHVTDQLRVYLVQLQYKYPHALWLFPGRHGIGHLKIHSIKDNVEKFSVAIGIHFRSHWFRHSLTTYRKYEKGCESNDVLKQLINHKSSQAIDVYDRAAMAMRRKLYDKYHPYTDF